MNVVGSVLIIGGGIGGTQAALDLSESGFKVYVLEKTTSIGGVMAQLDKTFPTNDCAMCIVSPKLVAAGRHPNIELIINAEINEVLGDAGDFKVKLTKRSLHINPDICTGCGVCGQKCPVECIDLFNEKMVKNKATFVKYPQAVPLLYSINKDKCIGCGVCEGVCKAGAVEYDRADEITELNVGSIILAPGFDEFDPTPLSPYGYGKYQNVVTSIEFERILSASGPYSGLVLRPSDGDIPEKLAFLQCVGSRDPHRANAFCSSVCCMYTAKEAVIAKEHQHQVNPTIFTMDIRAYGKDFDKYINRAQDEYGIRYIRSRVSHIREDPKTKNLILTYETAEGKITNEVFNMVVLAVGLNPPEDAKKIAEIFDIKLNEYGFCYTDPFHPVETSKLGIYVCGAFSAPKDIPETVIQASAAAGKVNMLLAPARGTLITKKEYPEEIDVRGKPPRIGVFICHCGINIGGVVDVPGVVEYAKTLPNVEYVERNLYTCSADTQTGIKERIIEQNLNRVIVASCTPRTHEPLFQETIREAGLNRYLFEMANIRDQCSWVHMHEPEKATEKAKDLVRMAVGKANRIYPLKRMVLNMTHKALIIGGGITGLNTGLGFAKQGYETYIIEQDKKLGGYANNIHRLLEEKSVNDYLDALITEVKNQDNLKIYNNSRIKQVNGYVGNFEVIIEKEDGSENTLESGVIVVATGGKAYVPDEYNYKNNDKVITQIQLENQIFENKLSEDIKNIVMIQCVGSRNEEYPYCSRICCAEAIKNAILIKEKYPEKEIIILYRDIRTYGFKEKFYRKAREAGVIFLRFNKEQPPELIENNGIMRILLNSPQMGEQISMDTELVVLSTGIRPPMKSNEKLAPMLKVPLNDDGFFLEAHVKLRPVDFATEGVFLAGLAHSPKSIEESIMQSYAAVSRASTLLSKEQIESEGTIAFINPMKCSGCGLCVETCSYNAVSLNEEKHIAEVNTALCKGCGACSANCRSSAIDLLGFTNTQLYLVINQYQQ
ncbi:MAG: 4Fe-4S dicluster domain-containing protein [Candidatus Lokiarchaeota archaeon]|nr:4Fe-4S dicluster domain-containing protein [Candidatus Lokiarchaeota archaeon]